MEQDGAIYSSIMALYWPTWGRHRACSLRADQNSSLVPFSGQKLFSRLRNAINCVNAGKSSKIKKGKPWKIPNKNWIKICWSFMICHTLRRFGQAFIAVWMGKNNPSLLGEHDLHRLDVAVLCMSNAHWATAVRISSFLSELDRKCPNFSGSRIKSWPIYKIISDNIRLQSEVKPLDSKNLFITSNPIPRQVRSLFFKPIKYRITAIRWRTGSRSVRFGGDETICTL